MAESRARIVTFLERHVSRDVALKWKDSLDSITNFRVPVCTEEDMRAAWQ
ncbi:MAG: hypothetical protein OXN97_15000 [Bryobacterales bacterium]|nr:hypothetical protein [Bryobacterales bacterium]